ncbi:MAG: response regulator [Pseudomonadota bacterium]
MDLTALIIDDSLTCQSVLKKQLEGRSIHVHCEETGDAGLNHIASHSVDLIFLDETLANENGLNVLSKIKAAYPQQTVVMYTAMNDPDYIQLAKQKGALGILNKNLNPTELNAFLNKARHALNSSNTDQSTPAPEITQTPKFVRSFADIDHTQSTKQTTAREKREDDISAIFNRARFDNLTHHLEQTNKQHEQESRRIKWLLCILAVPLTFLLLQNISKTYRSYSTPTIINEDPTNKSEHVKQLEYHIVKQDKLIEKISAQLEEHQQALDTLNAHVAQVSSDQQTLSNKVSTTARTIETVKTSMMETPEPVELPPPPTPDSMEPDDSEEAPVKQMTRSELDEADEGYE